MFKVVSKVADKVFGVLDTSDSSVDNCSVASIIEYIQSGINIEGVSVDGDELTIVVPNNPNIAVPQAPPVPSTSQAYDNSQDIDYNSDNYDDDSDDDDDDMYVDMEDMYTDEEE